MELIKSAWVEQKEIKNVMLFLTEHGVSTAYAVRIYKAYEGKSIEIVRENPYRLADDVWGVGFKTADKIAEKLGFDKERYVRCRGGILYALNELSNEGHCYAERGQLTNTAIELLGIDEGRLSMTMDDMIRMEDIIKDYNALYLPPLYYSEIGVANRLFHIQATATRKLRANSEYTTSAIQYSPAQKNAIYDI